MKIECELEPLRRGWPAGLELSVQNQSADQVLVLQEARWSAPLRGSHAWSKEALGALRYESQEDVYVLATTVGLRAPLALQGGVLLPGARARTMLATSSLALGAVEAALEVSARSFPLAEFPERVYQIDPASAARPIQRFARGAEPEGQVRDAWVHLHGAAEERGRYSAQLEVVRDAEAPADAALAEVAGGRLVGRSRRLGGAWVVADPGQAWTLVRGAELLTLRPGTLDALTLEALDGDPPFVPLDLVFRSEAALAWRDASQLPWSGAELGQQRLEAEHLWALLGEASRQGLQVRWGRHATIAAGLIVS